MKNYNIEHEADRIYILWNDEDAISIEDACEIASEQNTDAEFISIDYSVANHYGYQNCAIFSNN